MAKCKKCGRKGLFLRLDHGICSKCIELSPQKLSYEAQMSRLVAKELTQDALEENILKEIRTFGIYINASAEYNEIATQMAFRTLTTSERPEGLAQELLQAFEELNYDDVYADIRTKCGIAASAKRKYQSLKYHRNWYIWYTCHDERVRESHKFMDGVICNWNDPPNPGHLLTGSDGASEHPGYGLKCRCSPLSVISFKDISFPARVHVHGEIKVIATIEEMEALDRGYCRY